MLLKTHFYFRFGIDNNVENTKILIHDLNNVDNTVSDWKVKFCILKKHKSNYKPWRTNKL